MARKRRPERRPLQVETLEERQVLAFSIFQQGLDLGGFIYAGTVDTQLSQSSPDSPGVNNTSLLVDFPDANNETHVLLRFSDLFGSNVGQVPVDAIIVNAFLEVSTNNPGDGGQFYRMLQDWDAGAATWNSFGAGVQPDDIEATSTFRAFAGSAFGNEDVTTGFQSFDVSEDVRFWQTNPSDNFGWGMVGWENQTDGWAYNSSENSNALSRPKLIIEWVPFGTSVSTYQQGLDGYSGVIDTTIQQADPENVLQNVDVPLFTDFSTTGDTSHTLIQFSNLTGLAPNQIPVGATILSATLDLETLPQSASGPGDGGSFHRMLEEWDGFGLSWFITDQNAIPPEIPLQAFGNGIAGIQADGIEASSTFNAQAGRPSLSPNVFASNSVFDVTEDIQAWVDGESNFGWVFLPWQNGSDGWGIASSESADQNFRPKLTVYWSTTFTAGDAIVSATDLTVNEEDTNVFSVVLDSAPTSNVIIPISVTDSSEVAVSTSNLVFTPTNWDQAQLVTVTGAFDNLIDGDQVSTVILDRMISSDARFSGQDPDDITVTTIDSGTGAALFSFQQGVDGYNDAFEVRIDSDAPGTNLLGADNPEYFLDGLPVTGSGSPDQQDLLRFDNLFGVNPNQIPLGAKIVFANLTITTGTSSGNAPTAGFYGVRQLLRAFDANTTHGNFGSQPGVTQLDADATFGQSPGVGPLGAGDPAVFDVTDIVQAWAEGEANFGFNLFASTTDGWQISTIGDPNVAERPLLEIAWLPADLSPVTQTVTFQQGVNGYAGTTMARLQENNTTTDGATLDQAFLDGPGGGSPDDQALIKFEGIFGVDPGLVPTDVEIVSAFLVFTTGNTSTDAQSGGPYDVHQMLVDWDFTSTFSGFGGNGPTIADGEIAPATDSPVRLTFGTQVFFDVTETLQSWQQGDPNFGFNVQASTSDGWQINWLNTSIPGAQPKLVVTYRTDNPGGIIVTPTSGLQTSETETQDSFTVVLDSQPTADVVIPVSVTDDTEATVSTDQLVFTPLNWNVAQTVTVTGKFDGTVDGNIPFVVRLGAALSADVRFNGINPPDVSAVNLDDGIGANYLVGFVDPLTVSEAGAQATFTVRLDRVPLGTVVVPITVNDATEGAVDKTSLVFDSSNWDVDQTVTISGVVDDLVDGDQMFQVTVGTDSTTVDEGFRTVTPFTLDVTNIDDGTGALFAQFQQGLNGYTGTTQLKVSITDAGVQSSTDGSSTGVYFLDGLILQTDGSPDEQDLIRFDNVFGIDPNQIPLGATIIFAELIYTTGTGGNAQTGGPYGARQLLVPFDLTTTYTSFATGSRSGPDPFGFGAEVTFPSTPGTPAAAVGSKVIFDVTEYVQSWAFGAPNHGFNVYAGTTDGWQVTTIGNANVANRPLLNIAYTLDPLPPPTTSVTFKQGVNGYTESESAWLQSNNTTTDGETLNQTFLDGGNPDDQALIQFNNIFTSQGGLVPDDANIVEAFLVMTTGNTSTAASSGGNYAVHQMLVDWDLSSTYDGFGGDGPTEADGEIGAEVATVVRPIFEGKQFLDVTSILKAWQAGDPNFGFNIQANTTDGWQVIWPGSPLVEGRPELIVRFNNIDNTRPTITSATAADVVKPNEVVTLDVAFTDPDAGDTHMVTVDWGDGTVENFTLTVGDRAFQRTHAYADVNGAMNTSAFGYTITTTINDGSVDEIDSQAITIDEPPIVLGVFTRASTWTASFLGVLDLLNLGDPNMGFAIPTGVDQLRTLPWRLNQLNVVFSEDVTVGMPDVALTGSPTAGFSVPAIAGVTQGFGANSATIDLASNVGANRYKLTLQDSIVDAAGNALDGEWVDQVSVFGSGDGSAGGAFEFRFNAVPGDPDASTGVTFGDVGQARSRVGQALNLGNIRFDLDGSGGITFGDVGQMRLLVGTGIGAAAPAAQEPLLWSSLEQTSPAPNAVTLGDIVDSAVSGLESPSFLGLSLPVPTSSRRGGPKGDHFVGRGLSTGESLELSATTIETSADLSPRRRSAGQLQERLVDALWADFDNDLL